MKVPAFLTLLALMLVCGVAVAEFRFPMPEFESGYEYPETHVPPPSRNGSSLR